MTYNTNMFKKYTHTGTWEEALSIFLFVKHVVEGKEKKTITISSYDTLELKDVHIAAYNNWVDNQNDHINVLREWIAENSSEIDRFKKYFGVKYTSKVELWSDRDKTPYYKEKLQTAFEFENYIAKILQEEYELDLEQFLTPEGQYELGENKLGIEIKNDTLISKYENLYIEYAEKARASNIDFVKSGILKKDNSKYFLIGDRNAFWIFKKERLVEIFKEERQNYKNKIKSARGILFKTKSTSLGFVYPIKFAKHEAISMELLVQEIKTKS